MHPWHIGGMFAITTAGLAVGLPAQAQPAPPADPLPDAYAVSGEHLAFFNTPHRRHTVIEAGAVTRLAQVSLDLRQPADVLVQFTSGIATVVAEGCPCSVRVSIQVGQQEPVVVKRVNLGAVSTTVGGAYQPDRQSADGSHVFPLPAGRHDITLIAQRVEGSSRLLHVFYQNLQALPFARYGSGR